MNRERALKVLLALVGLALLATLYPLIGALIAGKNSDISLGDQMILGIYFPFGVFFLLAIRNPPANRSLILAFAWSTIAHMTVMFVQSLEAGSVRDDWIGQAVPIAVSIALIALAPRSLAPQHAAGQSAGHLVVMQDRRTVDDHV